MQKTILVLALVFTCALADGINITWTVNDTKNAPLWTTEPKLIVAANDTNFTGKTLKLGFADNSIVLRGRNDNNNTDHVRKISVKELSYKNSSDEVLNAYNVDYVNQAQSVAEDVYLFSDTKSDEQGISQVKLIKFPITHASDDTSNSILITKNANKDDKPFVASQVFAHRGRYFIVYSSVNGTVWVSSVGKSDSKPETVVLSSKADPNPQARCIGLTGKDTLYCNWLELQKAGETNFFLAEATLEPLKNSTSNAADFFNGTQVNIRPDLLLAYNAGKQYGGIVQLGNRYVVRNYADNKTTDFTPLAAPQGYNLSYFVDAIEYLDDIALFWEYVTSSPDGVLRASGVQYVSPDGSSKNTNYIYQGFTRSSYVQYSDGSAFILAQNNNEAYLGKLWGDTKLSASTLQTAFVALFALLAGIILA